MDTGCSDAESSSSHGVSWSNLTTPCCVQGSRQRHYSRSHDLQNENVLLLVIFQTYGVSSRHDGHSYVCSMGLWFLLRRQRSRDALLSYRPKSAEVGTILPFVLTYHPDLPKVRDIVDKNWSIIESSDELKDIYQSKPVMAFRRPKSLRDFLVRARLKPNTGDDHQTGECRPCGRKKCQCCKMITSAGTVMSSSGATVRLRQNTDCTTENVVYLISCSSCNKQY